MEVRGIGQGGQISQDNLTKSDNGNNGTQNQVDTSIGSTVVQGINVQNEDNSANNDPKTSEDQIKKALDKLSGILDGENTKIEYSHHDYFTHDLMIKIVDKNTNQVIVEIPPKKVLDLVAKMVEMAGVFFDKKA